MKIFAFVFELFDTYLFDKLSDIPCNERTMFSV